MNILVVKIAEHFGKEVLKGAVYAAAVTGAAHLASRLVDKFIGGNEAEPPVVVQVIVNQDGVTVSQQQLGEQDEDCGCDEDCDCDVPCECPA